MEVKGGEGGVNISKRGGRVIVIIIPPPSLPRIFTIMKEEIRQSTLGGR
jgi:hypothetical protein